MDCSHSYALNVIALMLLIRAAFYTNTVYKKQATALLLGVSIIVIPNILFVLHLSPIKEVDVSPVFVGPAGLVAAWGMFRYKIFDLVPLARATVIETMNAAFIEKDFVTALKKHLSHFEEQTGIKVHLDLSAEVGEDNLLPSARLNILYIIKEALNNVYKHAKARNVKINFYAAKEELCVVIEDDGKGFDAAGQHKRQRNSFGLSIMQERAAEIGARIDIQSLTEKGTCITLRLSFEEGGKKTHESNVS